MCFGVSNYKPVLPDNEAVEIYQNVTQTIGEANIICYRVARTSGKQ
jgi:hypothetical protein